MTDLEAAMHPYETIPEQLTRTAKFVGTSLLWTARIAAVGMDTIITTIDEGTQAAADQRAYDAQVLADFTALPVEEQWANLEIQPNVAAMTLRAFRNLFTLQSDQPPQV